MITLSFSMIVFQSIQTLPENMLKLCIENVLPFAREIIIAEGATKSTGYFDGDTTSMTKDGHSNDGTIELLNELQIKYPDVIKLIPHKGFWNGKTEACNLIAKQAIGDYLFQLDNDEFWKHEDLIKIINILDKKKPDAVHFYANHFFGGFNYCIDETGTKWANIIPWMRIFRNIPGKLRTISHEPPSYTIGDFVLNKGNIITREESLISIGKLFHYSCVTKSQIDFKTKFFKNESYPVYWEKFKEDKNTLVFGDHVYKFEGEHPEIIKNNYLK